jgi:hypothetical protein
MQQSGTQFFIPAGGWGVSAIAPNDASCKFVVSYLITGAPVSQLIATYYDPTEQVPQSYTLGNSPIGGTVSTGGPTVVTATNLVNTGNALGTNVIQVSPLGDSANTFTVDNSGNVSIGDATHGGSFAVVGPATFGGRVQGNGTSNLRLDGGSVANAIEFDNAGVQKGFFDSLGLTMNGTLSFATAAAYIATSLYMNGTEVKSTLANSLFLGTSDSNPIRFRNNGTEYAHMDATSFGFGNLIAPNQPRFSTANGSVSGSLDLYCPIWGTGLKIGLLVFNNLNTASNITVLFPSAFNLAGFTYAGDIGPTTTWSFYQGGAQVGVRHMLTLGAAGAGGTSEGILVVRGMTFNTFLGTPDRIICQTTAGSGINQMSFIMGF